MTSSTDKSREDPRKAVPGSYLVQVSKGRVGSAALFNGASQLGIEHGSELYTLRLTKNKKMILTK